MPSQVIHPQRIQLLNDTEVRDGDYTLYWMQQSQRTQSNHALEFAIQCANKLQNRLVVLFVIDENDSGAKLRHFRFMLEGLQQVADALGRRNAKFIVRIGDTVETVCQVAKSATELVVDRGYLRQQREWRRDVARECDCRVTQVESDAIVPVELASDKREYAARTIRSKLHDKYGQFRKQLTTTSLDKNSKSLSISGVDMADLDTVTKELSLDESVSPAPDFVGGTSRAKALLSRFIENRLSNYSDRPSIVDPCVSRLSPYLRFGQISPLDVADAIESAKGHRRDNKDAFIEELLVRRELAINFVYYEADYDSLTCLPDWASETLADHENDKRDHHYTSTELEAAETHDDAWNAAMLEMKHTGYLHNHLRMYWGKKIIEWTNTTAHAYRTALDLNNKYFLDGRDPNSFANVLWLFGLHDRAHAERNIFGKVRYMSYDGLKRKMDVDRYVESVRSESGVES